MNQKSQMQNLFWKETKRYILIARQFCYIYFDDSKAEEKSSDNTTKKSCKNIYQWTEERCKALTHKREETWKPTKSNVKKENSHAYKYLPVVCKRTPI